MLVSLFVTSNLTSLVMAIDMEATQQTALIGAESSISPVARVIKGLFSLGINFAAINARVLRVRQEFRRLQAVQERRVHPHTTESYFRLWGVYLFVSFCHLGSSEHVPADQGKDYEVDYRHCN